MIPMIYDAFQQKAIDYINEGYSVIVSAPTGAGKTAIAEHVIQECIRRREKVIYTAPIKALSNQKYRDFQKDARGDIGILTGDVTINGSASTLIMTTEIFRNKILEEKESLKDYSWIIYDEIHYLDDFERGSVWEESLIFLPDHMKILGLSATIPNVDELAGWFHSIHDRPLKVVKEDKRPVPLHFFFQCQGRVYDNLPMLEKEGPRVPERVQYRGRRMPSYVHVKPNPPASLIKHLFEKDMLPCIYFVFSRRATETLAEEMKKFDFLNAEEKARIRELFRQLCDKFDLVGDSSAAHLLPFIERGIAYHHAGMLPTLKEMVERLFTSRLIKVIFTTETFALGINMPARTVIFDELRKFYGRARGILKTRDFYQMAGRAGRRSIDTEGFVFCRVNPYYVSSRDLRTIIYSEPEKVVSRFNASYATILNLYQKYGEQLYDVYPRSFHHYQEKKYVQRRALELLHRKVNLLKDFGYIRKNRLTEKGLFACNVYGYEMILSELHAAGVLDELSGVALGVLCLAVVYEPRKGARKPPLSRLAKRLEQMTKETLRGINKSERRAGIRPLSKPCFFHLSSAMEGWGRGEDFGTILRYIDIDEGELVRYFRMAMQILRELLDTPLQDETKNKIHGIIKMINRDVIDAERQLRS